MNDNDFIFIEPDLELTINTLDDDSFCVNIIKADFCRQCDFFHKLFVHNKTAKELTLPFDKQTIEACFDLVTFISSIRIELLWCLKSKDNTVYMSRIKAKILKFAQCNFIVKLQCLTYLCIRIEMINFILECYEPSSPNHLDFDIDEFIKLDIIPHRYRWGFWSLYGNSEVKPDKPKSEEYLFCVNLGMETYQEYTIVNPTKWSKSNPVVLEGVSLEPSAVHINEGLRIKLSFCPDGDNYYYYFDVILIELHQSELPKDKHRVFNLLVRKRAYTSSTTPPDTFEYTFPRDKEIPIYVFLVKTKAIFFVDRWASREALELAVLYRSILR